MRDVLRVHVVFHPESDGSLALATLVKSVLDPHLAGQTRSPRVPVRTVNEPSIAPGSPGSLDLTKASMNAVLFLDDRKMAQAGPVWDTFLDHLIVGSVGNGGLAVLPFGDPEGARAFAGSTPVHFVQRSRWPERRTDESSDTRFLLHVVTTLRALLGGKLLQPPRERLFVSFSSRDGRGWAEDIVDFVNGSRFDADLPLFYDAKYLRAGKRFDERIEAELRTGTLLALMTDTFDASEWCNREMVIAKRARRPIMVADLVHALSPRTFPYGANVPLMRLTARADGQDWIARLLLATHVEGLRCDLVHMRAATTPPGSRREAVVLPREPELLDVAGLAATAPGLVLYPKPPLNGLEISILREAMESCGWRPELETL